MTPKFKKAMAWVEGAILVCCVLALLFAYGRRNIQFVRPVVNMFHYYWNTLVPALAF